MCFNGARRRAKKSSLKAEATDGNRCFHRLDKMLDDQALLHRRIYTTTVVITHLFEE